MHLLGPFTFCKILKKFLEPTQSYEMCHFQAQNGPFVPKKFFFCSNHFYQFHLYIGTFHCAKFKKFLEKIHIYEDAPFLGPKWSICPNFLFGKLLISFSSTYQPLSLCKSFKKFFQRTQSYEDAQFLGPKWPIPPTENFFRKPVNQPFFFHSCLSTCQKSKSDINLLVKY